MEKEAVRQHVKSEPALRTSNCSDACAPGRRLYIGIIKDRMSARSVCYDIMLGPIEAFSRMRNRFSSVRRVHPVWEADMRSHYINFFSGGSEKYAFHKLAVVGYISYNVYQRGDQDLAITDPYRPLNCLLKGKAGKMPYFVEAMATYSLKKEGYTHISTTDMPSDSRIRQLYRVGLPVDEDIHIDEWLKGMGRGIRLKMKEEYSHEKAGKPMREHIRNALGRMFQSRLKPRRYETWP